MVASSGLGIAFASTCAEARADLVLTARREDRLRPDYVNSVASRIVAGRMGDPEALAATLVWLISDAGGYVIGQTVVVDGGVTIT